jgi:hypothetical protein
VRTGTRVGVGDTVRVDVTMETGGIAETVHVVAEQPLLNTTTGVSGTTIDSKQIAELPLGDGTAYMLTRLAPGIADSSDLHFARPADNGNLAGIVANGVQGGNEFTIDGAPNMSNLRGVGFSPPSDAIQQFKVQTSAFDAQTGHTAGAVVNLALKSGSNALHVNGSYFNRDGTRTETPRLTKIAGGTKPTRQYNRTSGTVTGPVQKDKTFFMMSFEHLRDVQPEPSTYTVPTEKMRAGDFSEFANQVYDPLTATGSGGTRTAFPNNVIPAARINPVAAAYAAYYPQPNRGGTVGNYFTNQLRPYDYNSTLGRVDHNFNNSNRLFASTYWNKRQEDRYNWAQDAANAVDGGAINGARHEGVRLPHERRRQRRLHVVALAAAAARRALELGTFRRMAASGTGVRPGEARLLADRDAADERLLVSSALHVGQLQHDERELDDCLARRAAQRLGTPGSIGP